MKRPENRKPPGNCIDVSVFLKYTQTHTVDLGLTHAFKVSQSPSHNGRVKICVKLGQERIKDTFSAMLYVLGCPCVLLRSF